MPAINPPRIEHKIQISYTTAELLSMISIGNEPPYRLIDDDDIVIVWDRELQAYLTTNSKPIFVDISKDTLEHHWQLINPTRAHFEKYINHKEEK